MAKRLIDANALIVELLRMSFFPAMVRAAIERMPTVDAVEVVHGRWNDKQTNSLFLWLLECSVCGEAFHTPGGFNYCPNCGAKMDGERKEK